MCIGVYDQYPKFQMQWLTYKKITILLSSADSVIDHDWQDEVGRTASGRWSVIDRHGDFRRFSFRTHRLERSRGTAAGRVIDKSSTAASCLRHLPRDTAADNVFSAALMRPRHKPGCSLDFVSRPGFFRLEMQKMGSERQDQTTTVVITDFM